MGEKLTAYLGSRRRCAAITMSDEDPRGILSKVDLLDQKFE
jgi:hypothetical protein